MTLKSGDTDILMGFDWCETVICGRSAIVRGPFSEDQFISQLLITVSKIHSGQYMYNIYLNTPLCMW